MPEIPALQGTPSCDECEKTAEQKEFRRGWMVPWEPAMAIDHDSSVRIYYHCTSQYNEIINAMGEGYVFHSSNRDLI